MNDYYFFLLHETMTVDMVYCHLVYNFFVLSKSNSKKEFEKNLIEIKKLLELLKGKYYDN